MPAECEISIGSRLCGVLAIGRCTNPACAVNGGAAFCASHGPDSRHWCSDCCAADLQRKAAQQQSWAAAEDALKRKDAEARAHLIPQIQSIAQSLAAARVEPECFYYATMRQRKLLGGWREVEDPARSLYGWYAGECLWPYALTRYDRESGSDYEYAKSWARKGTYVTADGAVRSESGASVDVRSEREAVRAAAGLNAARDADFYGSIVQELIKLARANGISV